MAMGGLKKESAQDRQEKSLQATRIQALINTNNHEFLRFRSSLVLALLRPA
jgi:hypothetical protein